MYFDLDIFCYFTLQILFVVCDFFSHIISAFHVLDSKLNQGIHKSAISVKRRLWLVVHVNGGIQI
jgi:hypothetical protein